MHHTRRLSPVAFGRQGHGAGRVSGIGVFEDDDVVGRGKEAGIDLHAGVGHDRVGARRKGGAGGHVEVLHVGEGVGGGGAGGFVVENALDVDVGGGVGGPLAVGVDVVYGGSDIAGAVRGMDVAEGGDGGVIVELGDVGDPVGVGVRVGAGAAGGVDDYGELGEWVGGDGLEEGGPVAVEGVGAGGVNVEGEDD